MLITVVTLIGLSVNRVIPIALCLGSSLIFLAGNQPFTIYSQIFDFLICVSIVSILLASSQRASTVNRLLLTLLISYVGFSTASLIYLPLEDFFKLVSTDSVLAVSDYIFTSTPSTYFYSINALLRLATYATLAYVVASHKDSKKLFISCFIGLLIGGLISSILGLLDYYQVIDLQIYRNLDPGNISRSRLQSTFGHPGWFAEYITITIPYILFLFVYFRGIRQVQIAAFVILVLSEIVLILAQARAGWITYPVTLFFCWLFFYLFSNTGTNERVSLKLVSKVLVSVPATVILSLGLIYLASLTPKKETAEALPGPAPQSQLVSRAQNIFAASDRLSLWREGIDVGLESPIVGLGYESFQWHAENLVQVSNSNLSQNPAPKNLLPTPHNFFISLFVNGGLISLTLWGALMVYMTWVLLYDLIAKSNYLNLLPLLSTISFHIYGVFQSMAYIPIIWFIQILNIGYALTVPYRPSQNVMQFLRYLSLGLPALSLVFYLMDPGHRNLLGQYSSDVDKVSAVQTIDEINFPGFYSLEGSATESFRWARQVAFMKIQNSGPLLLRIRNMSPLVGRTEQTISIYLNNEITQELNISKNDLYLVPIGPTEVGDILKFESSSKFVPSNHIETADNRHLAFSLLMDFSLEEAGLYNFETNSEMGKFRWTDRVAFLKVPKNQTSIRILIKASNPDILDRPVTVDFFSVNEKINQITLDTHAPRTIVLEELASQYVVIKTSRSWLPSDFGSSDNRRLGVALSLIETQ